MEGLVLGKVDPHSKPVVVGIDFGTANSGVAIVYRADPSKVSLSAPTATNVTQCKVPTALLQVGDGTWEFGNDAEKKYIEMLCAAAPEEPAHHLFKRFKVELLGRSWGFDSLTAMSTTGKMVPLMVLITVLIRKLKEHAMQEIACTVGVCFDPLDDVQWVLTVPAIWNNFGKAFVRKAAYNAGLMNSEQSDNLILVREPEAAALAVHVRTGFNVLYVGCRFLVLDCRGGTVDITGHEVTGLSPLTMKAITAPCGGPWGGDNVNIEFKKFLNELLGPCLSREQDMPLEFYQINRDFEDTKKVFGPAKNPHAIRLTDVLENKRQLVELAGAWNTNHPDRPILTTPDLRNGFLTMSKELMLSFFEPFLKATVDETRKVMRESPGVRHIMVVGGFGASRVVTERICREFHNKDGVRVIPPDNPKPQAAVMLGALYFGLYKDQLASSSQELPEDLLEECDALIAQFTQVPPLRDAIQQRDQLQRELSALQAAGTDFRAIAAAGKALKAATAAAAQQPLSEEDYLALADRHAALVQRVTARCKELTAAEAFAIVILLGSKLKELKALDVPLPPSAKTACPPLGNMVDPAGSVEDLSNLLTETIDVVAKFQHVPSLQDLIRKRDELQKAFSALVADSTDFVAIGEVGIKATAATAAVAQQPLSEEAYLTLADRSAALVQRVTVRCRELASAEEFDALDTLAAKLEELKVLDVSALPQSNVNDPVLPPPPPPTVSVAADGAQGGEEVNDPAMPSTTESALPTVVSPTTGATEDSAMPPLTPVATTTTTSVEEVLQGMGAMEEGANNPVMPPVAAGIEGGIEVMRSEEWANDPMLSPDTSAIPLGTADGQGGGGGIEVMRGKEWANDPVYVPAAESTGSMALALP